VPQHLFIVSREHPDLHSYLSREFSQEPGVHVMFDRRQADRRRLFDPEAAEADRRQADRRENGDRDVQLAILGYAFVRV
jgi:hypothetical protein